MPANEHPENPAAPAYQTDLAQTPLPEILLTIANHKVAGSIECGRGNEQKEIFVERGLIIFATSNQVRDSLGDKLLREGRITQDQYDESVRHLLGSGKRQGTILTEMNVLAPAALFEALREQILAIVWSVLAWDAGTVAFRPGRQKHNEFIRCDVPIPQCVMEGVRHMPDPKALVARLGTKATILVRTGKATEGLTLDSDEQCLLDAIDGKRTLYDLINTPPLGAGTNARILYAFLALELISSTTAEPVKVRVRTDGDTFSSR
ncbi:MAG TPA: DUF4388 domain-containing protein [Thermoanaerobaculia bacterium]|nr:DUF4388 domain-containing protein [Thermoanaerobaculia bacterium]